MYVSWINLCKWNFRAKGMCFAVLIDIAKLPCVRPAGAYTYAVSVCKARPQPLSTQCVITHLYLKRALQCIPFLIWELTEFPGNRLIKCQDLKLWSPTTWFSAWMPCSLGKVTQRLCLSASSVKRGY